MTTEFPNIQACLTMIAVATELPLADVEAAWETAEPITIGWPQYQAAQRFVLDEHIFAITDFRKGKAVWSIAPGGFMVRL